jgi:hypothetical protein
MPYFLGRNGIFRAKRHRAILFYECGALPIEATLAMANGAEFKPKSSIV